MEHPIGSVLSLGFFINEWLTKLGFQPGFKERVRHWDLLLLTAYREGQDQPWTSMVGGRWGVEHITDTAYTLRAFYRQVKPFNEGLSRRGSNPIDFPGGELLHAALNDALATALLKTHYSAGAIEKVMEGVRAAPNLPHTERRGLVMFLEEILKWKRRELSEGEVDFVFTNSPLVRDARECTYRLPHLTGHSEAINPIGLIELKLRYLDRLQESRPGDEAVNDLAGIFDCLIWKTTEGAIEKAQAALLS